MSQLSSCRQRRPRANWADAQTDLSLRWGHKVNFVRFGAQCEKVYPRGGAQTLSVNN